MRSPKQIMATAALALVAVGVATVSSGQVAAQDGGGSLTLHSRLCPTDRVIDDLFDDCHDTIAANVSFAVDGPGFSGNVDVGSDGNGTVGSITPGSYAVSGGVQGGATRTTAFCSVDGVTDVGMVEVPAGTSFTARVAAGVETTCDIYAIALAGGGTTPTPVASTPTPAPALPSATPKPAVVAPAATRQPVTTLPSTGSGDPTSSDDATALAMILAAFTAAGAASVYGLRTVRR